MLRQWMLAAGRRRGRRTRSQSLHQDARLQNISTPYRKGKRAFERIAQRSVTLPKRIIRRIGFVEPDRLWQRQRPWRIEGEIGICVVDEDGEA